VPSSSAPDRSTGRTRGRGGGRSGPGPRARAGRLPARAGWPQPPRRDDRARVSRQRRVGTTPTCGVKKLDRGRRADRSARTRRRSSFANAGFNVEPAPVDHGHEHRWLQIDREVGLPGRRPSRVRRERGFRRLVEARSPMPGTERSGWRRAVSDATDSQRWVRRGRSPSGRCRGTALPGAEPPPGGPRRPARRIETRWRAGRTPAPSGTVSRSARSGVAPARGLLGEAPWRCSWPRRRCRASGVPL
jgi:hypothetical protein